MIPIVFATVGEQCVIKKIDALAQEKQSIKDLGFVVGQRVTVVTSMGKNLIVNIGDTRVAISKEMALKIMV